MDAPTSDEDPRHAPFLDLCVLYGDGNRPVFLEAVLRYFVRSADSQELAALRSAIRDRAKSLRAGGKRGRPRTRDDDERMKKARREAWQRHVLNWTWPHIASEAGIKPSKGNLRTLKRRQNEYAATIWGALARYGHQPERLRTLLESRQAQQMLWVEAGLPFKEHAEECKKIVLALEPRGLNTKAGIIASVARTLGRKRNG